MLKHFRPATRVPATLLARCRPSVVSPVSCFLPVYRRKGHRHVVIQVLEAEHLTAEACSVCSSASRPDRGGPGSRPHDPVPSSSFFQIYCGTQPLCQRERKLFVAIESAVYVIIVKTSPTDPADTARVATWWAIWVLRATLQCRRSSAGQEFAAMAHEVCGSDARHIRARKKPSSRWLRRICSEQTRTLSLCSAAWMHANWPRSRGRHRRAACQVGGGSTRLRSAAALGNWVERQEESV